MNRPFFSSFGLFLYVILSLISAQATAQDLTLKEVSDAATRSQSISAEFKPQAGDELKPQDTPLSTLLFILKAMEDKDLKAAASHLDLRYLPPGIGKDQGETLIKQLGIVWSQQNIVDLSTVSDQPEGHLDDGLPSYRDLLGTIRLEKSNVPVYLQRIPDGEGNQVWKISNATVSKIPELWSELGYHPLAESISTYLPAFTILDMENWQFVSLILIVLASWYLTAAIRWLMQYFVSFSSRYKETMQRLIRRPLRMFLFFSFVQWAVGFLGLSVNAQVWVDNGTLGYLATLFLVLGIIEFSFALYISRKSQSANAIAIMRPLVTTLKIIATISVALSWFDDAGFSISTILTGLGIGSLAIALAAQKTLENVFGAFTLFFARPIKPGDFCKFGTISGTVEEIGLRSTRIRKLDRSVVHVPNSVFSSGLLENYEEIDRRLYSRELRLRLDTTPDQIRVLLIELRKLVFAHPKTLDVAARVRFENIERDAFLVVINVYVDTVAIIDFKAISEDLNLRVLEAIRGLGIELAIPEQHVYMSAGGAVDNSYADNASETIETLVDENKLPFPDFSQSELNRLKNNLTYPPKGSGS
jgi:MscS family membrane protein